MIQPTPHPKTGVYRLRLTMPAELRETARRIGESCWELTVSLHTKDKREAIAAAPAELDALYKRIAVIREAYEGRTVSLTQRDIHAIAGTWYNGNVALNEAAPGNPDGWDAHRDTLLEPFAHEADENVPEFIPSTADTTEAAALLLQDHGIVADARSTRDLAVALRAARINHADLMLRRANGDYGPDGIAAKFPAPYTSPVVGQEPEPELASATFSGLIRGWARDNGHDPDAKPVSRAYYDRDKTAARLAAFLGQHEATKVTKADAVRWKEDMQARGKAAATVANDISEMSAVWRWAMAHGKATENPFAGILPPKKARKRKATRRGYEPHEATLILTAAREEAGALRWLPWVLAATGARLSEVCQSTKDDIIEKEGLSFLRIHEDEEERAAGEAQRSVKNEGSERMVPIHPALVAEGFLTYVADLPPRSTLFPDITPDKVFGSRGAAAQKIVSRWLRSKLGITDKQLSPSHSWRHWWIDRSRDARMLAEIRNAITGHADDGNESHRYGRGWRAMPQALATAMGEIEFPQMHALDASPLGTAQPKGKR